VNGGRTWDTRTAPSPPTSFHVLVLRFQPEPDTLLWLGDRDCKDFRECHVEAQYSRDNGRTWTFVEKYVVNCAWAVGTKLVADEREILCESYSNKTGSQMLFQMRTNPLALVEGPEYFRTQKKIFDHVVGFTKFSEFLVVAEVRISQVWTGRSTLTLVRTDRGRHRVLESADLPRRCAFRRRTVPSKYETRDPRMCLLAIVCLHLKL
jgi:hypothetical protein